MICLDDMLRQIKSSTMRSQSKPCPFSINGELSYVILRHRTYQEQSVCLGRGTLLGRQPIKHILILQT
jgi:hypothetical protein